MSYRYPRRNFLTKWPQRGNKNIYPCKMSTLEGIHKESCQIKKTLRIDTKTHPIKNSSHGSSPVELVDEVELLDEATAGKSGANSDHPSPRLMKNILIETRFNKYLEKHFILWSKPALKAFFRRPRSVTNPTWLK